MSVITDPDAVSAAYEDVRNDATETSWALCKYDEKRVVLSQTGTEYDEFLSNLQEDDRAYAYIRFQVGDELSKRSKFALVTWVGPGVSPLQKAKVSTDKAFVKQLFAQFQTEVLADDKIDLTREVIEERIRKAGGANYGTGK